MIGYYVLKDQEPVVASFEEWADWWKAGIGRRTVAKTNTGCAHISTVFLGMDHAWGHGPPLLFETMIFGGPGEYQTRCSTWEQALEMHAVAVRRARWRWLPWIVWALFGAMFRRKP